MGIGIGDIQYIEKQVAKDCVELGHHFDTVDWTAESDTQIAFIFLRMNLPGILLYLTRNYAPQESIAIRHSFMLRQEQSLCKILKVRAISPLSMQVAYLPFLGEKSDYVILIGLLMLHI